MKRWSRPRRNIAYQECMFFAGTMYFWVGKTLRQGVTGTGTLKIPPNWNKQIKDQITVDLALW